MTETQRIGVTLLAFVLVIMYLASGVHSPRQATGLLVIASLIAISIYLILPI